LRHVVDVGASYNNRFVHCGLGELRAGLAGAPPDDDAVSASLARGRAAGADQVAFAVGEPTIHAALPSWIAAARVAGYRRVTL
jgi:hypothetical protein